MKVAKLKKKWGVDFRCPFHGRCRQVAPENSFKGANAYLTRIAQIIAREEDPCGIIQKKIATEPKKILFKDYVPEWFSTYVQTTNKPSERGTKESHLRVHLLPWFGETSLENISTYQIEQFKASKIQKGMNPKTVNNILACLSKCLVCAVDWEKLKSLPKIKKLPFVSQRIDFLSPLESGKLLQYKAEPLWHEMIFMGLRTGMRFGELTGLSWEDVDMERRIITVRYSLVKGILGTPKNGKIRHLKIANDLHEVLMRRKKKTGFVFRLENEQEITYRIAANAIRRTCKRAGSRRITWHVLRHTFASQLVSSGVPLPAVKEMLGHASINTTMKYAHLAPSVLHEAVEIFQRIELEEMEKDGTNVAPTP